MDKDQSKGQDSVYSNKVRAGRRRKYFFDVRQTKGDDYYITLTESTKRFNGEGYSRHKIFLYKEDFNRFLEGLQDAIDHVKNELMPDYDYEQFDRRQEEWELQEAQKTESPITTDEGQPESEPESTLEHEADSESTSDPIEGEDEEDMTW